MVAGNNEVDSTVLVPGPCFLEAVVHRERGTRILASERVPTWYRFYGFVTVAAQHNVESAKQCGFTFDSELASYLSLSFDYSLT